MVGYKACQPATPPVAPEVAAGRRRLLKSLRRAAIGDPSHALLPAGRIDRKQGVPELVVRSENGEPPERFPQAGAGLTRALGERNPKWVLAAAEAWRPWRATGIEGRISCRWRA
jgi:hypothetical protein